MRTAVSGLLLQSQRLAKVARTEFAPKLSASASTQRNVSALNGNSQLFGQTQTSVDLNWRLRTGANIKFSQGLVRNLQSGQQANDGRNLGVSITQPLLKGAGRAVAEANLTGAESAFRVASKALEQTAQTIVGQALGAYIAVQQAQAATRQAQAAFDLAQRLHELNQAMVTAGRSPRNVLLQSESDVAVARLGIAQAENVQRQVGRTLAQSMGRSAQLDGFELVLTDQLANDDEGDLPDEQALVAKALEASSELFAAQEAVVQAELALALAQNGLLPSLALSLGTTVSESNATGIRRQDHSVGLSFEYSFDRAALKLEKSTAQINLDTTREQLANTEQRVRDSAVDALRNLSFARAQHALAHTALVLAAQQLDAEVTRQSLGRTSQLELSTAQQSFAASSRQLLDAARQVFRSRVELAQIEGGLLQRWGVQPLMDKWLAQAKQELEK